MSYRTRLALVLGVGVVVRLWLAFDTHGLRFDLQSYALVQRTLGLHPLHVYSLVDPPALPRWPYPSGFFAVLPLVRGLSHLTGLAFTSLVRVPSILADAAIAWLVQDVLRARGVRHSLRLAAAAAVALGPLFIANSAYDGQLDSLAVLPAVAAVALWDRQGLDRRALIAGLLIGVGCALKSFPLLTVLALLPSCRSAREAATLVAAAVAVPALALAPFLAADAHAVISALRYHSLVGTGGISLVVQPDLAGIWLGGAYHPLTSISHALQGTVGVLVSGFAIAAATLLLLRLRVRALDAATLVWLTVFAFSINFGPRYALWGLPFFLMRGNLTAAVVLQVALIVPTWLLRAAPFRNDSVEYVYAAVMILVWAASLAGVAVFARRLLRDHGVHAVRQLLPGALATTAQR